MAFGQSSGPPATGKQLNELLELLSAAGHSDFRDARGPMGFNQRQAGGKFTRDEADEFIEQLQTEVYGDGPPAGSRPPDASRSASRAAPRQSQSKIVARPQNKQRKPSVRTAAPRTSAPRTSAPRAAASRPPTKKQLESVSAELLAEELRRRGWTVEEP